MVVENTTQNISLGKIERGFIFIAGKGHYGPRKGPAGPLVVDIHVYYPGQKAISDEARENLRKAEESILEKGDWRTP